MGAPCLRSSDIKAGFRHPLLRHPSSVDPSSGEVKVEKPIDRESRSDFNDNEIRLMVIIEVGIGHGCYTHFYNDKVTLSLLLTKAKFLYSSALPRLVHHRD